MNQADKKFLESITERNQQQQADREQAILFAAGKLKREQMQQDTRPEVQFLTNKGRYYHDK